jgi:hypothetical protein
VLDSVYALKTLYVFCPLDASCTASAFPPPEHFYEHNVRTFSVHHVALEYYGKAMREHADGAFQVWRFFTRHCQDNFCSCFAGQRKN